MAMTGPEPPDETPDVVVDERDLRMFDEEDVEATVPDEGAAPMGTELTAEEVTAVRASRVATGNTDPMSEVN
jgi:hypothetical protein